MHNHFISFITSLYRTVVSVYVYIYTYTYIYIYIYIFTKYIKITAFQTSPVEKEGIEQLNFTFQASNSKFQAETRIKISKQVL